MPLPSPQVLEVTGPTVAMDRAYFGLVADQQSVTLAARLSGMHLGMAPVTVTVSMDQRAAAGVSALEGGDAPVLWSQQLHWDAGSNASQPVSLYLPQVRPQRRRSSCRNGFVGKLDIEDGGESMALDGCTGSLHLHTNCTLIDQ